MLHSAISYMLSNSNYGVTNMHNIYNFILVVMDSLNDDQKRELIDKMILHLGRQFYTGLRAYTVTKVPNSEHLQFMRI